MAKKFPADANERTTAQGLFLSADAYLEAASILLEADTKEGHAPMPIRFLLFHASELYLKAFLRSVGLTVPEIEALGHRFDELFDKTIALGFKPAAIDHLALIDEQENEQLIRSRYLVTGTQRSVPLRDLYASVAGLRKDLRNHPALTINLIFRPWDVAGDNSDRQHMPRIERTSD